MNKSSTKRKPSAPKSITFNKFTINSNAYYSVTELSLNLSISKDTVLNLIQRGTFSGFKWGRQYVVTGDSIIAELQRRERQNAQKIKKTGISRK